MATPAGSRVNPKPIIHTTESHHNTTVFDSKHKHHGDNWIPSPLYRKQWSQMSKIFTNECVHLTAIKTIILKFRSRQVSGSGRACDKCPGRAERPGSLRLARGRGSLISPGVAGRGAQIGGSPPPISAAPSISSAAPSFADRPAAEIGGSGAGPGWYRGRRRGKPMPRPLPLPPMGLAARHSRHRRRKPRAPSVGPAQPSGAGGIPPHTRVRIAPGAAASPRRRRQAPSFRPGHRRAAAAPARPCGPDDCHGNGPSPSEHRAGREPGAWTRI